MCISTGNRYQVAQEFQKILPLSLLPLLIQMIHCFYDETFSCETTIRQAHHTLSNALPIEGILPEKQLEQHHSIALSLLIPQ